MGFDEGFRAGEDSERGAASFKVRARSRME
jgi:hypothetical protein